MTKKDVFAKLVGMGYSVIAALAMTDSVTDANVAPEPEPATSGLDVNLEPEPEPAPEKVQRRRKRGPFRARVAYRLTKGAARKLTTDKGKAELRDALFPTTRTVLTYVAKHGLVHAGQIQSGTGLKMKTVESDVYKLRTYTTTDGERQPLIEAVPVK